MKTLLVLAPHPDMAEAVRSAANPEQYRVLYRSSPEEAEPLLIHGLANACILDLDLTSVQAIWLIEKLRRRAPRCPMIVFCGAKDPQWEEEAYLQGVVQVLIKPVRPRLLASVIERLWAPTASAGPVAASLAAPPQAGAPAYPQPYYSSDTTTFLATGLPPAAPAHLLHVLRSFSGILTHSLNAEAMLKQFLLLLRDLVSINRGVIFLRQPVNPTVGEAAAAEPRRFRAYASLGVSSALMDHFELSLDEGIGGHVLRLGRILRRTSEEARQDLGTHKEFELLGAQVAIPMFDRETVIGVALFDGRITGESLSNPDLELIFHLLEPLGLAVKNIWLHDQLSANHQMMAGILREISSACLVVSRDLAVLHANKTARKYFTRGEGRTGDMEFSDLPEMLGTKIYQVLKTGSGVGTFRYSPEQSPGTLYNVTIVPFQAQPGGTPSSALLMADDITHSERLRTMEVKAANSELVVKMAERLAHEIGNAIMPLSTLQQLFGDKWKDSDFRKMLDSAMTETTKRVIRRVKQMRCLASGAISAAEAFPLVPLIDEAYQEACKHQSAKPLPLEYRNAAQPVFIRGDRPALALASAEVLLNALQANPDMPKVVVTLNVVTAGDKQAVQIDIEDNGPGFTKEAFQKVPTPFYTTRTVGLGLGLAVTQHILQAHGGRLEILPPAPGKPAVVRITLPLEASGKASV